MCNFHFYALSKRNRLRINDPAIPGIRIHVHFQSTFVHFYAHFPCNYLNANDSPSIHNRLLIDWTLDIDPSFSAFTPCPPFHHNFITTLSQFCRPVAAERARAPALLLALGPSNGYLFHSI
jgi:hypothetical protein